MTGRSSPARSAASMAAAPWPVGKDTADAAPEQRVGAVRVPAQVVRVPRAHLGQPLEELLLFRPLRLPPGVLPGFVSGKEPSCIEVPQAETVVLLKVEGSVVFQAQAALRSMR